MRIGLIDVDLESRGKCTFPNLALMKIAAYHKQLGDQVKWYDQHDWEYDIVYVSKVFSDEYTKDYTTPIHAKKIVRGGSGYAIKVVNGVEVYDKSKDPDLPCEIEHQFPYYQIYRRFGIKDTAYGFLTKGCPRGCNFCHVKDMQGKRVYAASTLSEFWKGQKNIVLLDPNLTAAPNCVELLNELAQSGAYVDFSQGLDIRLLTIRKIEALNNVKYKMIHFAWDDPNDDLRERFSCLSKHLKKCDRSRVSAYCLTNFNSTHEQDIMRIMHLRSCNIQPYVMVYRKATAPTATRRLQRWCNMPALFWKYKSFQEYQEANYKTPVYE